MENLLCSPCSGWEHKYIFIRGIRRSFRCRVAWQTQGPILWKPHLHICEGLSLVWEAQKMASVAFVSSFKPRRVLPFHSKIFLPHSMSHSTFSSNFLQIILFSSDYFICCHCSRWDKLGIIARKEDADVCNSGTSHMQTKPILDPLMALKDYWKRAKTGPTRLRGLQCIVHVFPTDNLEEIQCILHAPKVKLQPADRTISAAMRVNSERQVLLPNNTDCL